MITQKNAELRLEICKLARNGTHLDWAVIREKKQLLGENFQTSTAVVDFSLTSNWPRSVAHFSAVTWPRIVYFMFSTCRLSHKSDPRWSLVRTDIRTASYPTNSPPRVWELMGVVLVVKERQNTPKIAFFTAVSRLISVDSDPRRENPPHLLQTPELISGWHRYTSITPVTPANSWAN